MSAGAPNNGAFRDDMRRLEGSFRTFAALIQQRLDRIDARLHDLDQSVQKLSRDISYVRGQASFLGAIFGGVVSWIVWKVRGW